MIHLFAEARERRWERLDNCFHIVSNREKAYGLERAKNAGIPTGYIKSVSLLPIPSIRVLIFPACLNTRNNTRQPPTVATMPERPSSKISPPWCCRTSPISWCARALCWLSPRLCWTGWLQQGFHQQSSISIQPCPEVSSSCQLYNLYLVYTLGRVQRHQRHRTGPRGVPRRENQQDRGHDPLCYQGS